MNSLVLINKNEGIKTYQKQCKKLKQKQTGVERGVLALSLSTSQKNREDEIDVTVTVVY